MRREVDKSCYQALKGKMTPLSTQLGVFSISVTPRLAGVLAGPPPIYDSIGAGDSKIEPAYSSRVPLIFPRKDIVKTD